jgi:Flp pilus assembly protein TadG
MRRFWSDRKGNVAILFALAMIPVMGAMGAAVDYSFANALRTNMQKSLDSAGLALSKMMPLSQDQLNTLGNQFFLANFGTPPPFLTMATAPVTIVPSTGKLDLSVTGTYKPELAGILRIFGGGDPNFPIGTTTQVVWGLGKVEVALALDNTGSMSSNNKLVELKTAAHNLLEILKNAAQQPGDAKVSIVAFGVQTKVDPSNYNAAWVKWNLWEQTNGSCSNNNYTTKTSCTNNGHTWTAANHNTWTGCIADRDKDPNNVNHNVKDTSPTSAETYFPADDNCGALATSMPLNYNWGTNSNSNNDQTTLHGKINAMQAVGNTNVTIGLAWGWNTLSPTTSTLPFAGGVAYGTANYTKFLIILTDGNNTQDRWTTNGNTIDTRTAAACTNIKAKGIKIYSIRVINGDAALLQGCASDPSMYYDVQNASELTVVFNAIGSQIANLHLSK